jgi:hypothetical protein
MNKKYELEVLNNLWLKCDQNNFLLNNYNLYEVKLLLLLLMVEMYTLWHYIFTYLVRISIHNGSGPCHYIASCIRASRIYDNDVAELSHLGSCVYIIVKRLCLMRYKL